MRARGAVGAGPGSGVVAGALGTTLIHAAVLTLVLFHLSTGPVKETPVYNVQLVAAPAVPAEAAKSTPAPSPPPPEPPAPTKVAKIAKKTPVAPARTPKQTETAATPPKPTPTKVLPGETAGTGSDILNLDVRGGKNFPFPDYLRNIVNQVYRRWARPVGSGALVAEVAFTIQRDGTVQGIKITRSSRNYDFDVEAQGAVDQAAGDRAFGPLPPGWPSDLLQVAVQFTPRPQ